MAVSPTPVPPSATANTALRDAMVRHQIQLQRFSANVTNKVHALLNASEQDLADMIRNRLLTAAGLDTPADVKRLQTLLGMIENLRNTTWATVDSEWKNQLTALATAEPSFLANQLDTTSPAVLDLALPAITQLKALVTAQPFEGATLKEWSSKLRSDDKVRIESQIRLGMMAGEDSATIARRIVGSARLLGADGVTEITRRNADAISRTAVNFISNQARRAFINSNKDLFSQEMYLATLDSRTTPLCRSLDGDLFEVGKGPIPPLHWNCRSTRVPVLDGKVIGQRPARAFTEQQMLREFAEKKGIKPVPKSRKDLPHGTKGEYDEFARAYMNAHTGQVPASMNYQDWLKTQSASFQDDILGKAKGKLFRDGGLDLKKFVNRNGDEITLADLAKKQAEAFRAAGFDPGDF